MLTLIIHFACVRSLNYCKILITPPPPQHILMEEIYVYCFVSKIFTKNSCESGNWTSVIDILLKSAKIILYVCMFGIDHGVTKCVLFCLRVLFGCNLILLIRNKGIIIITIIITSLYASFCGVFFNTIFI